MNIASVSYNQSNLAFSGRKEVIDKSIKFVRSPHFSGQAISQALAPILFNTNISVENMCKIKLFGDIVELGCNLISRNGLSIAKQPTNLFVISANGVKKIIKLLQS